jgi:hypothetical protein
MKVGGRLKTIQSFLGKQLVDMKFGIFFGLILGVWFGWFFAINYTITVIERKQGVMTVEDWSRMRELTLQLRKDKMLFF